MADQKSGGGKKNRKYGRNVSKCKLYKDRNVRERNKLKRILQSNGLFYAQWWAHANHVETILDKLLKSKGEKDGRLRKRTAGEAG